jgi:hypothetical protein
VEFTFDPEEYDYLPTDWAGARDLLILGVVNTVFPFALITWGEKSIESGLAAVLRATAALFSMVVAHFMFVDERMSDGALRLRHHPAAWPSRRASAPADSVPVCG